MVGGAIVAWCEEFVGSLALFTFSSPLSTAIARILAFLLLLQDLIDEKLEH